MKKMFVVEARRKLYKEAQHSYVVAVTDKKQEAIDIGRIETLQRSGKYDSYLIEIKNKKPQEFDKLIEVNKTRDFGLLKKRKYENFLY